jgi:hypothetical protein
MPHRRRRSGAEKQDRARLGVPCQPREWHQPFESRVSHEYSTFDIRFDSIRYFRMRIKVLFDSPFIRLTGHSIRGLFDSGFIRFDIYSIRDLFDSIFIRFDIYSIQYLFDSRSIRFEIYSIRDLFDSRSIRFGIYSIRPLFDSTTACLRPCSLRSYLRHQKLPPAP